MRRVALSTDTVSNIPSELAEKKGITLVPILLELDGRTVRDTEVSAADLYDLIRRTGRPPRTASPPPAVFRELFSNLLERHDSVLHITYASNLGAAYGFAVQAAANFPPGKVEVLDSRLAILAQGFVVMAAAERAIQGASLEEVRAEALRVSGLARAVFFLETLEFLRYSGRVPAAAAWVSDFIGVKPVVQIANGKITLVTRVRTRPRAIEFLKGIVAHNRGSQLHVGVMHSLCPQDAQALAEEIADLYRPAELYVVELSPFVGAHTGPGALGLAFYWD
jgi:DegV family protein with EDD domain